MNETAEEMIFQHLDAIDDILHDHVMQVGGQLTVEQLTAYMTDLSRCNTEWSDALHKLQFWTHRILTAGAK